MASVTYGKRIMASVTIMANLTYGKCYLWQTYYGKCNYVLMEKVLCQM